MQNSHNKTLVILCAFFIVSSTLSMMTVGFSFKEDETHVYSLETLESFDNIPHETNNGPLFSGCDPVIHQMMNETDGSNIYDHIDTLQNFENEDGIRTRRDGTLGFERAVNWTYQELNSFGLDVFKQNFTYEDGESTNVIAEIPGSDPELESQTYILGAHLDSINSEGENESAPGADDNGSGIALMLESARILSEYEFNRTIRFAAWGAEELGLHGSSYHASNIDPEEEDLRGKFNYDMVGYAEENIPSITLHANAQSGWMLDYQKDVAESYEVDLNFTYEYESDETRSDHASFWDEGYDASLAIETEFNPDYHSEEDTLDKLTIPQISKLTSHAVGTVAHLAQEELEPPYVEIQTPKGSESWESNSEEEIRWYTEEGTGNITGVDLEYTTDNGTSWSTIDTNLNDTSSYLWTVPEESTSQAKIRITVHDDNGMSAQNISGSFNIEKYENEKKIPGFTLPVVILGVIIVLIVHGDEKSAKFN
ncbi:MAG: M28 family metallopeptidase [Candidatus Natronoplasma sp.]